MEDERKEMAGVPLPTDSLELTPLLLLLVGEVPSRRARLSMEEALPSRLFSPPQLLLLLLLPAGLSGLDEETSGAWMLPPAPPPPPPGNQVGKLLFSVSIRS